MTPGRDADLAQPPELSPTQPRYLRTPDNGRNSFLPLVLVVAVMIGAGLYYVANTADTDTYFGTNDSAGNSVTKTAPTPN